MSQTAQLVLLASAVVTFRLVRNKCSHCDRNVIWHVTAVTCCRPHVTAVTCTLYHSTTIKRVRMQGTVSKI